MKAIIIEEKEFKNFLQMLDGKEARMQDDLGNTHERLGISKKSWQSAVREARREFQYYFVTWAQEQGASCTRA